MKSLSRALLPTPGTLPGSVTIETPVMLRCKALTSPRRKRGGWVKQQVLLTGKKWLCLRNREKFCFLLQQEGTGYPTPANLAKAGWGSESTGGRGRPEPTSQPPRASTPGVRLCKQRQAPAFEWRGRGEVTPQHLSLSVCRHQAGTWSSPGHRNGSRQTAPTTAGLLPEVSSGRVAGAEESKPRCWPTATLETAAERPLHPLTREQLCDRATQQRCFSRTEAALKALCESPRGRALHPRFCHLHGLVCP